MNKQGATVGRSKSLRAGVQILVPGLYAWLLTVLPAAAQESPSLSWVRWLVAVTGLVALSLGAWLQTLGSKKAIWLGLWTFTGTSALLWIAQRDSLVMQHIDPVRGALGSLAWLLFALGWGRPWTPNADPNTSTGEHPNWTPRNTLPFSAPAAVAVATAGAASASALAWLPSSPSQAYVAQSFAVVVAAALLMHAGQMAVTTGRKRQHHRGWARISYALPWGLAWIALIVIVVLWRLRR